MKAPSTPSSGEKLDLNALNGALLHITVHELVKGIDTSFGVTNAVRVDVAVLDGDHKGDTYDDTLIFPRVLQSQLSQDIGDSVLGRLGKGEAKPGKSAPWLLQAPSAADLKIGEKYEAYAATQKASQEEPF
jgi:hypothetical protein